MSKESYPESGLKRRVLAYNDKLFLAEHEMVLCENEISAPLG